jgi:hypothetical protein
MKARILVLVLAAISLTVGGRIIVGQHGSRVGMHHAAPATYPRGATAIASAFALPTAETTRTLLEGAVHTSEFADATVGREELHAYVSYPDRADKAPVVVVNTDEGMSDWARALGFQASRDGFIAVVPDRGRPHAVRQFAADIPAANGTIAGLEIRDGQIAATVGAGPAARFPLDDRGWSNALRFLSERSCVSIMPGITRRPRRSMTLAQALCGGTWAAVDTDAIRSPRITRDEALVPRASIVAILPL